MLDTCSNACWPLRWLELRSTAHLCTAPMAAALQGRHWGPNSGVGWPLALGNVVAELRRLCGSGLCAARGTGMVHRQQHGAMGGRSLQGPIAAASQHREGRGGTRQESISKGQNSGRRSYHRAASVSGHSSASLRYAFRPSVLLLFPGF